MSSFYRENSFVLFRVGVVYVVGKNPTTSNIFNILLNFKQIYKTINSQRYHFNVKIDVYLWSVYNTDIVNPYVQNDCFNIFTISKKGTDKKWKKNIKYFKMSILKDYGKIISQLK